MGRLDPISLLPALAETGWSVATRPDRLFQTVTTGMVQSWSAGTAAAVRALGAESGTEPQRARDKRFTDPAWEQNAVYWLTRELYSTWAETVLALVRDADTAPATKQKAEFAVQLMIDAVAPTNSVPGNPAVLKKALETGGLSLMRGARNFVRDLLDNEGAPRQVATGAHVVGKDMAVTPGKVVFRNDLMELIQYAPTTPQVHEIPLLFSPPWINKYYIMDLAPGRSLVQWAVDHGHTVFMISYRNPDAAMRHVSMDDYLISGPIAALEVVTDITGFREGQPARAVPGRHADHGHPGVPGCDRAGLDQLGDLPQHLDRLQRARTARRVHR